MDYDNLHVKSRKAAKSSKAAKSGKAAKSRKAVKSRKAAKMEKINSKRRISVRHSKEKNKTIEAWLNTYAPPTHQELVYEEHTFEDVSNILWEEWLLRNEWRFDDGYFY